MPTSTPPGLRRRSYVPGLPVCLRLMVFGHTLPVSVSGPTSSTSRSVVYVLVLAPSFVSGLTSAPTFTPRSCTTFLVFRYAYSSLFALFVRFSQYMSRWVCSYGSRRIGLFRFCGPGTTTRRGGGLWWYGTAGLGFVSRGRIYISI